MIAALRSLFILDTGFVNGKPSDTVEQELVAWTLCSHGGVPCVTSCLGFLMVFLLPSQTFCCLPLEDTWCAGVGMVVLGKCLLLSDYYIGQQAPVRNCDHPMRISMLKRS